jgi:glycosyltransferase involved in cell wall biosynthesis
MSQIELNKEFEKHNVYIFPSRNETCSNALLEAKAKGIPILAINDAGNKEIINIDSNLFNDKHELIQKIKDLTFNYERYNNFKQNSESKVIEGYNRFIFEIKKTNKNLVKDMFRIFGFLILKPLFRLKKQKSIYKYLKKVLT